MAGHARAMTAGAAPRGRAAPGFTLVEILVVLAILATLIAMVAAGIPYALKQKEVTRGRALVNGVGATIEMHRNDTDAFGKYYPTRLRDLKVGKNAVGKEIRPDNEINAGAETLWYCQNTELIHTDRPANTDVTLVDNTDADTYKAVRGTADNQAREWVDPWGWPLVYFHCNDYKDPKGATTIKNRETQETLEVHPRKVPQKAGGGWLFPNSFQLFSVGPDGKQDDPDSEEEGDDIVYGVQ